MSNSVTCVSSLISCFPFYYITLWGFAASFVALVVDPTPLDTKQTQLGALRRHRFFEKNWTRTPA